MAFLENTILFILVVLSIWSVAIMIDRYRVFKRLSDPKLLEDLDQWVRKQEWNKIRSELPKRNDPWAGTLGAAEELRAMDTAEMDRAVKSFLSTKKIELEKGFTTLATLGSNAPFIGLFGTVLGIIRAFAALSESQAGSSSVMEGISMALVATAAGLLVAIPAVVAFNVFSRKLQVVLAQCEALYDLYVSRLQKPSKPGVA